MKTDLIQYLRKFTTEERFNIFNDIIRTRTQHISIVLENIYQPHNISASLRSAECFGIQDVHIIENNNEFNEDANISMNSGKWLSIHHYKKKTNNTLHAIKSIKEKGYQLIATTPRSTDDNVISLYDLKVSNSKIAIVFGSEVNGCSQDVINSSDHKIHIPMYGFTESFNLSVSVALCLHHLTHKLRASNIPWQLDKNIKKEILLNWLRRSIKSSKRIEQHYKDNIKNKP
jgi:tRNA (guanosine-2'-O-)-methyltransferase